MKKVLSLILAILMLAGMTTAIPFTASAVDTGRVEALYTPEGTGISNLSQITDLAGSYYLTADIALNTTTVAGAFTGTFDGNGKTVTTIYPLFAQLNGTVKNLTVAGNIDGTAVAGDTGAIARVASGATLENISSSVNVTGYAASVSYTYYSGATQHTYRCAGAGGLVGACLGGTNSFTDCVNSGTVKGSNNNGGIVGTAGFADGTVVNFINCDNSGTVSDEGCSATNRANVTGEDNGSGGIIGFTAGATMTFTDCDNSGAVTSAYAKKSTAGGIFPSNTYILQTVTVAELQDITVINCTNSGAITGSGQTGGLAGWGGYCGHLTVKGFTNSGAIKSVASTGETGAGSYAGGIMARPTEYYNDINDCINTATGTVSSVNNIEGGIVSLEDSNLDSKYSGCVNYADISVDSNNYAAGIIAQCATVGKFEMINCANYGDISAKRTSVGIGGLIAYVQNSNDASISYCVNNGKVTNTTAAYCGGIVARMGAEGKDNVAAYSIKNCTNNGEINAGAGQSAGIVAYIACATMDISGCVNNGTVQFCESATKGNAGGIMSGVFSKTSGCPTVTVTDCVNNGTVNGANTGGIAGRPYGITTFTRCYNSPTGVVIGTSSTGGIVGGANNSSKDRTVKFISCGNEGSVTGSHASNGAAGICGYAWGGGMTGAEFYGCYNVGTVTATASRACGLLGYINTSMIRVENCYIGGTLTSQLTATPVTNGAEIDVRGYYTFTYNDKPYYFYGTTEAVSSIKATVSISGTTVTVSRVTSATDNTPIDVEACVFDHDISSQALFWEDRADLTALTLSGNYVAPGVADVYYINGNGNAYRATTVVEIPADAVAASADIASGQLALTLNAAIGNETFYQTLGADTEPVANPTHKRVAKYNESIFNLTFSTVQGAEIRLTEGSTGIRFYATADKTDFDAIATKAGAAVTEIGTIIAPKTFVDAAGAFTFEALDAYSAANGNKEVYVKAARTTTVFDAEELEDGEYTLRGSLANIKPANYDLVYCAIAYIKIGDVYYYSNTYTERSVTAVAQAAIADISNTQTAEYQYELTGTPGAWSPYTAAQQIIIRGFIA